MSGRQVLAATVDMTDAAAIAKVVQRWKRTVALPNSPPRPRSKPGVVRPTATVLTQASGPPENHQDQVPHRPVNNGVAGARERGAGEARPSVLLLLDQAAGSRTTVCPSGSSWATGRRAWASSWRRASQSGPRSA